MFDFQSFAIVMPDDVNSAQRTSQDKSDGCFDVLRTGMEVVVAIEKYGRILTLVQTTTIESYTGYYCKSNRYTKKPMLSLSHLHIYSTVTVL